MTRLSLRLRLALFGAAAILAALGLAAWGLSALFGAHVEDRAIDEMGIELEQVLAGLTHGAAGLTVGTPPTDPRFTQPYGGLYWQVETPTGIIRSRSLWDATLALPANETPQAEAHVHRLSGPEEQQLIAVERVVTLPASLGGLTVKAVVASDAAVLTAARREFNAALAPYLLLLGAVLIAAQLLQLTLGLRPLQAIGARVAALRAGEASRMGGEWPAEMQPLANEIDGLLAAREADIERARNRAADLAHGLKTPLQALLGETGRLRQRGDAATATAIEDVAGAMQRHVDRELARARSSTRLAHARANVAETVERVVAVLKRTPRGEAIGWTADIPRDLAAALDPADLAEAIGALAENAMRHAKETVAITGVADGNRIALCIRDDGPGIPEAALQAVTGRGARLDQGGAGSGLGLAIASDIAEAAGGKLLLANEPGGFAATLELPAAR